MLQAYALQTYLEGLGCDVMVINQRSLSQRAFYSKPGRLLKRKTLKAFWNAPSLFLQNIGKWNKFEQFMRDYYHLSYELPDLVTAERFINDEIHFDAVITGGDQIWNMNCLDFSLSYFLPFETPGIRRIAYSPSLGDEQWWRPQNYARVLKALVDTYDFPSVRENSASVFLSHLIGRSVPSVPDPTLLLGKDDYDRLAGEKPMVKGRYIFYYSPLQRNDVSEFVARYAKICGFRVVSSNKSRAGAEKGFISYNNSGPSEFLNLIKNATIVCGFSFHLVLFSLVFHKQFFVVTSSGGSRIKCLLDEVGLSSRMYYTHSDPSSMKVEPINWESIDNKMREMQLVGESFLREALA